MYLSLEHEAFGVYEQVALSAFDLLRRRNLAPLYLPQSSWLTGNRGERRDGGAGGLGTGSRSGRGPIVGFRPFLCRRPWSKRLACWAA